MLRISKSRFLLKKTVIKRHFKKNEECMPRELDVCYARTKFQKGMTIFRVFIILKHSVKRITAFFRVRCLGVSDVVEYNKLPIWNFEEIRSQKHIPY